MTTNGSPHRVPAPADHGPPARVVLVGRTGLESALSNPAGVELVVVRTAADALCAVSAWCAEAPIADPSAGPGHRVGQARRVQVVVLGEALDADPTLDRALRFVRAVRRLDPTARVLAVGRPLAGPAGSPLPDARATALAGGHTHASTTDHATDGPAGEAIDEAFDGWLDADDPAYSARVLLRGSPWGTRPRPPAAPLRPAEVFAPLGQQAHADGPQESTDRPAGPQPVGPAVPASVPSEASPTAGPARASASASALREAGVRDDASAHPGSCMGDGVLVRCLLDGQPIQDQAMALLAERLGVAVTLEKAPASTAGPGRAPVPGRGDLLLVAPCATGRELEAAAAWLGGWLALADRLAELDRQANTDPLTGALNRRAFDRALTQAIERARQARHDVSVLVFDIDDFKHYNDRYGHQAGDEILCEIVRLLESVIRPTDRVCRIGGDEFAVIFDDPAGPREPASRHPRSVVDLAQRFQAQVAAQRFPKLGDQAPGRLTISGGLATFPWDGLDGPTLLRVADQRALESKRQGKNAIELGPTAARP
ncbi:MAG: hypothetical protein KatS3mg103_1359 [Phycisphaerales bacterium]|nr:MAG: hypothetical protein KatS3mg103_1359 [Phycisphaerales bacterium]